MADKTPRLRPLSPTLHMVVIVLVTLFLFIVIGSFVTKTEIVARGQGTVIPTAYVQLVQAQNTGRIEKILVKEGQFVHQGDLLIQLDQREAINERARVQADIAQQNLQAQIATAILTALRESDPLDKDFVTKGLAYLQVVPFSGNKTARMEGEKLISATLQSLQDKLRALKAQENRIERSGATQHAQLDRLEDDRQLIQEKLKAAKSLMETKVISQAMYLERLHDFKNVEHEILTNQKRLEENTAEIDTLRQQRQSLISDEIARYRQLSRETELNLQGLKAKLDSTQYRLDHLSLYAPVDGRIDDLSIHTLGGFIEAGKTLMRIVPVTGGLIVEAFFDNRDIGFLEKNQRAYVKFSAFPPERFGVIYGTVVNVGATARYNKEINGAYAVLIKIDQDHLNLNGKQLKFIPGMTVTADVITAKRRLISYFFEPITKILEQSLQER
ncbi:HlyD family type I secretion periplasmic adaptor subunit [Bartonella machadoae]|uniref:HlyD family type I secretion periplasmic adaptor subunit n=1 Tax=Bartonella machadoae TaxID=2893471 RepID=UPI001F4D0F0D|nr:HlyD family type I secretion periplasmic adaptor subunit [Bartonella machadoae]UNE54904.1 HlyD family type I secretion periplasmic adaptor subunit [Bartonella machadoae]